MKLFICSLMTLLISACNFDSYEERTHERAAIAEKSTEEIIIGIAWDEEHIAFLNGVNLAVKKINEEGGLLNRSLKIIINTDESKLEDTSLSEEEYTEIVFDIAKSFAINTNIIAVVGHSTSKSAILASVLYQNHGLLFLTPSATNIKLTSHQFDYVFRAIPNNEEMGIHLADYVAKKGYKKIAILYDRGNYATELSDTFSTYISEEYGAKIIFRHSFFENKIDLTSLAIDLKKSAKFDIIFIAASDKFTAKLYQKTRDIGMRIPFVGGETLDRPPFLKIVKAWEDSEEIKKSIIPTLFNIKLAENQEFVELYKQEYDGKEPNQFAALGYDNITLLAHAIKRAQSTIPLRVADSLRYMNPCQGLAGKYQFFENGELKSKPFYFKSLSQNKFDYQQLKTITASSVGVLEICNKIDRDKDSIPNDLDACPDNTSVEITKGILKTGLLRGCPIDTDEDEVPDYIDVCTENTLTEMSKGVNQQGCPLDTDADGKADYEDACPNNPELTEFISGKNCVEDKDGDEVTDDIDKCPNNSKEEIAKGVNKTGEEQGCPVDSDYDKVKDYIDACPSNSKLEISKGVNIKGCPADNDNDGIVDYQDACLNTPKAIQIDLQGCGIVENNIMVQPLRVYFKSGKITLTTQGKAYLKVLLEEINNERLKQVKIIVHTFNNKNSLKNQSLSEDQAATIDDYLQQQGLDYEKTIVQGEGDSIPILDNDTLKSKKQNSRLEVMFTQFRDKVSLDDIKE